MHFLQNTIRILQQLPSQAAMLSIRASAIFGMPDAERASATRGTKWNVTIIKEGMSLAKPYFYFPFDTLRAAVPMFEGAKVYAHKNGAHVDIKEKSTIDQVGWLSDVRADDATKSVVGILNLLPSATWLRENLVFAFDNAKADLYELSIDAGGTSKDQYVPAAEKNLPVVNQLLGVDSVDIVPRGAAGGKFNHLIQSLNSKGFEMKKQLLELLGKYFPEAMKQANIDAEKIQEAEILNLFDTMIATNASKGDLVGEIQLALKPIRESIAQAHAQATAQAAATQAATQVQQSVDTRIKATDEKILTLRTDLEKTQRMLASASIREKLADSRLPEPLQNSIRTQFDGKVPTDAEIDSAIKSHRETYAKLVQNFSPIATVSAGLDTRDKLQCAMDGFFLGSRMALKPLTGEDLKKAVNGVDPFRSIKQAYIHITGDVDVSGRFDSQRITQALDTGAFAIVLANSMTKRLVADYSVLPLNTFQAFADIIPLSDFKTQDRVRFGGYPNLPTVAESDPYLALTSPTDEKATYAATKKGGLETVTREMIKNDDLGSVQKIPTRMARAAAQTLHEFVFNLVSPTVNALIYDGIALYATAVKANRGTVALGSDGVSLTAARLRMKLQTQKDNAKRLGLRARYLLVPPDLEAIAYGLTQTAFNQANQVPTFLQQLRIVPIVVDYWTDATDWALVADKQDISGIEVGFIDGREQPELFVSDIPNAGSFFTNDVITMKIRHEYGGAITDFRAFDGSQVA